MSCAYCGVDLSTRQRTRDHVWPLSRYPQYSTRNYHFSSLARLTPLVDACLRCNNEKGNATNREWLAAMSITDARWPRLAAMCASHPLEPTSHLWKRESREFTAARWGDLRYEEPRYFPPRRLRHVIDEVIL